jgi:hypothetical protein
VQSLAEGNAKMKLHYRSQHLNAEDLPLFAWAAITERRLARPLPFPAHRIRVRFGLSPAASLVTAELAGFVAGEN